MAECLKLITHSPLLIAGFGGAIALLIEQGVRFAAKRIRRRIMWRRILRNNKAPRWYCWRER